MTLLNIPGGLTIERYTETKHYKWRSQQKSSVYSKTCRRATVRFSALNFVKMATRLNRNKRQVRLKLIKDGNIWTIIMRRTKEAGTTLQCYFNNHPHAQIVINKVLPQELWECLTQSQKRTITLPVLIRIELDEWKDVNLRPSDFLIQVEHESKSLLEYALDKGFRTNGSSKGRSFDVSITSPKGTEFIIAITSIGKKSVERRRKEKIVRKVLLDIAKMLPIIFKKKNTIPIVISRPMESEKTWSHTTTNNLKFYSEQFNIQFLSTSFKKGWEAEICNQLLRLEGLSSYAKASS